MDDNSLKSLKCSTKLKEPCVLIPKFNPSVKAYNCNVPSDCDYIFLTCCCNEPDAFYQIQKANSDSSVSIKDGAQDVEIKVDAADGSSVKYVITVYRPTANDASIKTFSHTQGTLIPDFHRLETNYFLIVDETCFKLDFDVSLMNPKSQLDVKRNGIHELTRSIDVNIGDTLLTLSVTSADSKATETYTIIIQKGKFGTRLGSLDESVFKLENMCSFCCGIVFQPRKFTAQACNHKFCFSCFNILQFEKLQSCPVCNLKYSNMPLLDPDLELQQNLNIRTVNCPFSEYGCGNTQNKFETIFSHVSICKSIPITCIECEQKVSVLETTNGKHTATCVKTCACGRKIPIADLAHHENICPLKLPNNTVAYEIKLKPWAMQYSMDKKSAPASIEACYKEIDKQKLDYKSSLSNAINKCRLSMGDDPIQPNNDCLLKIIKLLNTAININAESKKLKGGTFDMELYLKMGYFMEEYMHSIELFPMVKSIFKNEPNENQQANESFMNDEVDGLLLQLGISSKATNGAKLQAIEDEYQRLLHQGLSDQASEVQGLYQWKVSSIAKDSGLPITNNSTLNISGDLANVIELYEDAVGISPNSPDANLHLGRCLLLAGNYKCSINHLRIAFAHKPTWCYARMFYGASLILLNEHPDHCLYGVNLLEKVLQDFKCNLWNLTAGGEITETIFIDNLMQITNSSFQMIIKALFKGYLHLGRYQNSVDLYLDILYLIPEKMRSINKRSIAYKRLGQMISSYHSEMLHVLSKLKKESSSVMQNIILDSLLVKTMKLNQNDDSIETLDFIESICETLSFIFPCNSSFLSALGTIQLNQYDKNSKYDKCTVKLNEAKMSFQLAIAIEDSSSEAVTLKEEIKKQNWWIKVQSWKNIVDAFEIKKAGNAVKQVNTKSVPVKPSVASVTKTTKAVPGKPSEANIKVKSIKEPVKAAKDPKLVSKAKPDNLKAGNPKSEITPAITIKEDPKTCIPIIKSYQCRLGLARTISRFLLLSKDTSSTAEYLKDIIKWYKETIEICPSLHDAYIELGSICEKFKIDVSAADIYSSYPFQDSIPSQDDLYIHGEIIRLLMKEKKYKDPKLLSSLIAEGKSNGIKSLQKNIDILDSANEYKVLMQMYASINGKLETDPEMISFYKNRYWI